MADARTDRGTTTASGLAVPLIDNPQVRRRPSGTRGRDSEPVAVGVFEIALPSCEPGLVDDDSEFLSHCIDIANVQIDERVWASVTFVLGQVERHAPAGH
jgi:hypothetical protein